MRFLIALTFLFCSSLFAQALPIKIKSLKGKVMYYRDRTMSVLTERTVLKSDDLIMTKDGRVSLEFEETTLSFAPHSLFRIMNLKNSERHHFGEFLIGEFYSQTRDKLVDRRRLEVTLPKAKVHVIGTRYIVQISPSVEKLLERQEGKYEELPRLELIPETVSSNDLVTQVTCLEGKVAITTDSKQNQEIEVNESALYSGTGANLRVVMKDQTELLSLFQSLGFDSSDDKATTTSPAE